MKKLTQLILGFKNTFADVSKINRSYEKYITVDNFRTPNMNGLNNIAYFLKRDDMIF